MTSHINRLGNESRYVGLINSQTYGKVSHEIPENDKDIQPETGTNKKLNCYLNDCFQRVVAVQSPVSNSLQSYRL